MSEEHIKRLEAKLDDVIKTNNNQDIILTKLELILERNTDSLEEHMKRTEKNEERIELIENRLMRQASIGTFLWKTLIVISTITGIAAGISRAFF